MFEFSSQNRDDDVHVTGLGLVTPLGCSADATWNAVIAGYRAGRRLTREDIDHFDHLSDMNGLALHGAPVDHDTVARRLENSQLLASVRPDISTTWRSEPMVAMSLVAFAEAMSHAGLRCHGLKPERTAVVFGSSKGGLRSTERMAGTLMARCSRVPQMAKVGSGDDAEDHSCQPAFEYQDSPPDLWNCGVQPDSATRAITQLTGAIVASSCPVAACATGLIAMLQGAGSTSR
ncbi:MAG: beta-ketoacyl synthase N-terminal-like domain-containing protein [Planctomycetaceae bacterium]